MSENSYLLATPENDPYFLDTMAECAQLEMDRHSLERKEWNYHETLSREVLADLSARPPLEVEPAARYIYLGNLAVEKGHAEYDRITAAVFEQHPIFRSWKNIWVAEEEPHGDAMLQWAKASGMWDGPTMHTISQGYLKHGSTLAFHDAATGLAYPAFQEIATRLTHKAVKDNLPEDAKEGRIILSKIIGDEQRHERFYANMVRHALHSGDTQVASQQMRGVARAVLGFRMPGMEDDIPDPEHNINRAYLSTGAFTLAKLVHTVFLPVLSGEGTHGWSLAEVDTLDDQGRAAQERLLTFIEDLEKATDNERRTKLVLGKARREVSLT